MIHRRIKGFSAPRPLTHDLLHGTIVQMGGELDSVIIKELKEHTYFAVLRIRYEGEIIEVDARPSDAIAVAVIALAVWLMLVNDIGLGPWLLAVLVFAHGWVHLMFVFPKPEGQGSYTGVSEYPFDFGRSWLVRRQGLDGKLVRQVGIVLMVLTFALSLLAALATVGVIVPTDWWAGLMIAAAATSTVMLLLFYSPALILGFAINALMVALAIMVVDLADSRARRRARPARREPLPLARARKP